MAIKIHSDGKARNHQTEDSKRRSSVFLIVLGFCGYLTLRQFRTTSMTSWASMAVINDGRSDVWFFLKNNTVNLSNGELENQGVTLNPNIKGNKSEFSTTTIDLQPSQFTIQFKPDSNKKLNVIIFYPDDWSKYSVGLLDENQILKTPTFDRLAREGMHFLQNAVTTSICWISRGSFFTGQYVSNHRSTFLFRPYFTRYRNQWSKSWPYLLQEKAGYWVGHIGKWQYRDYPKDFFNFSSIFEGWIKSYDQQAKKDVYIAEVARDETLKFLRERPTDRPFAATVAFYPPKGIAALSQTKPEFAGMYRNVTFPEPNADRAAAYSRLPPFLQDNTTEARSRYLWRFETHGTYQEAIGAQYATISHIDSLVGEIVDELKHQGLYENTLLIVTADNGEFNGVKSLADKWYPYQESIQVPLIIRDPRMPLEKRGTQNDEDITLNIDLAETILGAAGIETPEEMDGRDIADIYLPPDRKSTEEQQSAARQPWRKEFYYEFPTVDQRIPPSNALIRKDWKYIQWMPPNQHHEELFHLTKDPVEMNNLAYRDDPVIQAKKTEMRQHMQELKHAIYWRLNHFVPGTKCDPMWYPRYEPKEPHPNCSPELPDRCCDGD